MRAVLFRSLAVIGTGALVLAGILYVASTVDARPPEVLDVQLTQAAADDPDRALITTSIEVAFSEPVEPDGAARAVSLDPPVPGSVSWSGTTMIFTPEEPLEIDTEYAVIFGPGVRDLAGNEMTDLPSPYTFTTAGRPSLASSEPADGERDVPLDATLVLDFSTLMDTSSVEAALEFDPPLSHDLRWSGERLEIVPRQPLRPGSEYVLRLDGSATDIAGVAMEDALAIGFRTVAPGLSVTGLVPADQTDGISPMTPIAVTFDRPIDPDSITPDLLEISPSTAGSLETVVLSGEADGPRILRFVPAAPLPANTTFEMRLLPGIASEDGDGGMAEPLSWTFTTGAPQGTLSNQVLFLSDRSGVTNVWAMNPDGTGQHQVSAELAPVLDYAAAPNGSSLVIGDGRRLVYLRADGAGREVLTEPGVLEFDAAYAPDASRISFARADEESGQSLGLWSWEIGSGAASRLELPAEIGSAPSPGEDAEHGMLRAPRYSPDGQALAYVDLAGFIGIVELPAERLTRIQAVAAAPPIWRPDSSGLLVSLQDGGDVATFGTPVEPLSAEATAGVGAVNRSGTRMDSAAFGDGARLLGIAVDGRIAYLDADATVRLSSAPGDVGDPAPDIDGTSVVEMIFGPAGRLAIVVVAEAPEEPGVVDRIDLDTGERTPLVRDGFRVRWLP